MTLLHCVALPDEHGAAEGADEVALVDLVHILSDVVRLGQVEVDVLVGHVLVHLPLC